jgi:hypothetical protein
MQVRTENYRFTHGHAPTGYGTWYFTIRVWGATGLETETVGPFTGRYGEARTTFFQHIRALGWSLASAEVAP